MRILIVDDEIVCRRIMKKLMTRFGECDEMGSGNAALNAFETAWKKWRPYDLIAMDISMPDMDGTEVVKEIRLSEKLQDVQTPHIAKIIMVTSFSDTETIEASIRAGCDDYIIKPISKKIIFEKIKNVGFDI